MYVQNVIYMYSDMYYVFVSLLYLDPCICQALLPHKEGEPAGWWIGTVTKSKGEVAGVQFVAGEEHYTDLVEHKNLRVPNSK